MLYHNVLLPHKKNITEPWKTRQQPQTSHTNPITHLFVVMVLSSLSLVTIYSRYPDKNSPIFWMSRECLMPFRVITFMLGSSSSPFLNHSTLEGAGEAWMMQTTWSEKNVMNKYIYQGKLLCTHLNLLPVLGVDKHLLRLNIRLVKNIKLDLTIKGFSFKF